MDVYKIAFGLTITILSFLCIYQIYIGLKEGRVWAGLIDLKKKKKLFFFMFIL